MRRVESEPEIVCVWGTEMGVPKRSDECMMGSPKIRWQ